MQGPDTEAQDQPPILKIQLATHGRSIFRRAHRDYRLADVRSCPQAPGWANHPGSRNYLPAYSRSSHQTGSGIVWAMPLASGWRGLIRILGSSRTGIEGTSNSGHRGGGR